MTYRTRYQAAILRDHHVLLIQHREHATGRCYWIMPGGGREAGESEEQAVIREMREETNLDVKVERLLLDEFVDSGEAHGRYKTYLCTPLAGEAYPGGEPEPEAAAIYEIAQVRWVNFRDESSWGDEVASDQMTSSWLRRVRLALDRAGSVHDP